MFLFQLFDSLQIDASSFLFSVQYLTFICTLIIVPTFHFIVLSYYLFYLSYRAIKVSPFGKIKWILQEYLSVNIVRVNIMILRIHPFSIFVSFSRRFFKVRTHSHSLLLLIHSFASTVYHNFYSFTPTSFNRTFVTDSLIHIFSSIGNQQMWQKLDDRCRRLKIRI